METAAVKAEENQVKEDEYLLVMEGIPKQFPGVRALDNVCLCRLRSTAGATGHREAV
jgi:hypothetical protein